MTISSLYSCFMSSWDKRIKNINENELLISYHDLIDHIILLRQVIAQPEMTQEGPMLDYFVNDYCSRMARQLMNKRSQQSKIPLGTEWIWHVHRLHPALYLNDCIQQLPGKRPIDKKVHRLIYNTSTKDLDYKMSNSSRNRQASFVPSLDLRQAAIRQREFLETFQHHDFYLVDLKNIKQTKFEHLLQNYIGFINLAKTNQIIVPTFNIDLIWHTHMRYPSRYLIATLNLCGYILDHDDKVENNILLDSYKNTAEQWERFYFSKYEDNFGIKV